MDPSVFADLSLQELRAWRAELVSALRKSGSGRGRLKVQAAGDHIWYDVGPDQHARIRKDLADVTAAIEARERGGRTRHGPIYLGLGG